MSSVITVGSQTITSNTESADDMASVFTPDTEDKSKPRVLVDKGQPVEQEEEKEGLSKAASELGKEGGKAAAKAKAKAAKAKPIPDKKEAKGGTAENARLDRGDDTAEADGDASDAGEVEAAHDEPAPDPKRDNPRHDAQARIRELAEERRNERARADQAERRAIEAERRALALERERTQPAATQEAQPPNEDAEPQEGDFENYTDYVKAVARHEYKQAARAHQREQYAHAQASQYAYQVNTMVGGWNEALSKAATEDESFRDTVKPVLARIPLPANLLPQGERADAANWIAQELMSAPSLAPGRLRYFREHDDELQRLATLRTPADVIREMARIDARLEAATTGPSPRREVSKAKPPFTPVTGSPHTADTEPDENAPLSAFVRRHGQRELAALKR